MSVDKYIDYSLPILTSKDTVETALHYMEDYFLHQFAVVDDNNYKGIVSEAILQQISDSDELLEKLALSHQDVFVHTTDHFFDALKKYETEKAILIPVLDDKGDFVGVVNLTNTAEILTTIFSPSIDGGIIVVAINERQYSLGDLCKICEAANSKIISCFAAKNPRIEGGLLVTLKLNKNDLTKVLSALDRYSYDVVGHFSHTEIQNEDKDRLDMFMKYLDI